MTEFLAIQSRSAVPPAIATHFPGMFGRVAGEIMARATFRSVDSFLIASGPGLNADRAPLDSAIRANMRPAKCVAGCARVLEEASAGRGQFTCAGCSH